MEVMVLYASMNGHTKVLADAIVEGAREVPHAHVVQQKVDDVVPDQLKNADAIIWGSSGYFGEPNPKMAEFFSRLGQLWFSGALQGKVGGVFATTSTTHGGVENVCRALQTPMQHMGMVIVTNTGALSASRVKYGTPYGATAVIPVETSPDAPMNKPSAEEMQIAREYGKHVVEVAHHLVAVPV